MRHFIAFIFFSIFIVAHAQNSEWHSPHSARLLIGETATICGPVGSARFVDSVRGQPTYINLGPGYPDHVFTIVIWGQDRYKFNPRPELITGTLCVRGYVGEYRGVPQIEVSSPAQISR